MDALTILSVVAFVALAVLFLVLLRRASVVFGETRRAVGFRQEIGEIEERVDADVAALAELVDRARTPDAPLPEEERFGAAFGAARDSVVWARERSRVLVPPAGLEGARAVFLDELGLADEALRSLEHGYATLSTSPSGPRGMEGRTAIKRGYLGLVHVREGLAAETGRVAAWRSAGERNLIARRQRRADHRM